MDFLPENYETPQTNANYLKFADGETRFRILSKPVIGWLDWKENKPLRFNMNNKPEKAVDPTKPIKHFWAMLVWNYTTARVQVLEITQATVQKAIENLAKDSDWGAPFDYDIKVVRKGKDKQTEYTVTPSPKKAFAEYEAARVTKICLNELFTGGDPFNSSATPTEIEVNPFQ